ncbi:imelysin family protein [Deminuibacter soli]|uniref:Imelysin-like domain-containing protein n=1 Tax=Deminuibacter soli TaxID=2291815 RepID=A0A3E1NPB7_9BACT|nr:imelysin family protein [Deminuibacter soli]RFM29747.1 hypothetical protein DXN05_01855 [Deminuibacter soli]
MKKLFIPLVSFSVMVFASCSKNDSTPSNTTDFKTLESQVVTDFVNNVALPTYTNMVAGGTTLDSAIQVLNANPTDANLLLAQTAWKSLRRTWERSEGFLIGPVEGGDYDPNTDTWPTDYNQMDSLLASNNALQVADVQNLAQTLRGYHPIEYLLFGNGGIRKASELDARKKQYLVSLSADMLNNNIKPLLADWKNGYANDVLNAGKGAEPYKKKQDLFLDLVGDNGMGGICNEVGNGKMLDPFNPSDSSKCESPYSHNTLSDFKDNIISLQNVYMGLNGGKGLKDLVAAKNKDLDNQIQAQITAAVNSFDNITTTYEKAVYNQRTQVQTVMNQINTLAATLSNKLEPFIVANVQD